MRLEYDHRENLYKVEKMHVTMFRVNQDKGKFVDWKAGIEAGRKFTVDQRIPINYVDVSTRFEYDETKFYTPLTRINIPQKNEEPNVKK